MSEKGFEAASRKGGGSRPAEGRGLGFWGEVPVWEGPAGQEQLREGWRSHSEETGPSFHKWSSSPDNTGTSGDATGSQPLPSWYFVPRRWFPESGPWAPGLCIARELAGHSNSQASLLLNQQVWGAAWQAGVHKRPGDMHASSGTVVLWSQWPRNGASGRGWRGCAVCRPSESGGQEAQSSQSWPSKLSPWLREANGDGALIIHTRT